MYQTLPAGEAQVLSESGDVLEEHVSTGKLTSQQRILLIDEFQECVKEKTDNIQRQQCLREMVAAMTEVVFEVIAFGL